jgi:hypothetical protein
MVRRLARAAEKEKLSLAPFIGIGCPDKIACLSWPMRQRRI